MNTATTMRSLQRASQTLKTHYAPFRIPRLPTPAQRCLHLRTAPPPLLRNCKLSSRIASQRRYESTSASANPFEGYRIKEENGEERPLTDEEVVQLKQEMLRQSTLSPTGKKEDAPAYKMTFTCRQCLERSSHNVSKQAYHFGTCLITCPGCKNRHLISDHLKIFSDKSVTLEDIMREKGELIKKGTLGSEGDVEFWSDGDEVPHELRAPSKDDS